MREKVLKSAIQSARNEPSQNGYEGDEKSVRSSALALVKRSKVAMLGTAGENGFVNIKALLNLKHRGLKQIWFSTNTSSKRVAQIQKDNRVCVYYMDENTFEGLMLTGTVRILQDHRFRKMLWTEGAVIYYPLGVDDPDYTVLGFTARQANYYCGLKNLTFAIS